MKIKSHLAQYLCLSSNRLIVVLVFYLTPIFVNAQFSPSAEDGYHCDSIENSYINAEFIYNKYLPNDVRMMCINLCPRLMHRLNYVYILCVFHNDSVDAVAEIQKVSELEFLYPSQKRNYLKFVEIQNTRDSISMYNFTSNLVAELCGEESSILHRLDLVGYIVNYFGFDRGIDYMVNMNYFEIVFDNDFTALFNLDDFSDIHHPFLSYEFGAGLNANFD